MASHGTPGSHLGPHRCLPSRLLNVSASGANLCSIDSLMHTFGAAWKQGRIKGVVIEKPKKKLQAENW